MDIARWVRRLQLGKLAGHRTRGGFWWAAWAANWATRPGGCYRYGRVGIESSV